MPGGAAGAYRGLDAELSAEEIERLLELEGLNTPIHARYRCWLLGRTATGCDRWPGDGLLRGDLGYSRLYRRPVRDLLAERMTHTLRVMVPAMVLGVLFALGLGFWSARRTGGWPDLAVSAVTFVGQSSPLHWMALLAIWGGAIRWGAFPPGGVAGIDDRGPLSYLHHAALPILCVTVYYGAFWTRYLRFELLSVAARPFVAAARAKGLTDAEVWRRHVLPNALVPMLTSVTLTVPSVFSGVLVVEQVFSYPGVGLLVYDSVLNQDPLTAMVGFLAYAGLAMLATSLGDALIAWLNPAVAARRTR